MTPTEDDDLDKEDTPDDGDRAPAPEGQTLRERLVAVDLVSHLATMADGYPSIVMHSRETAADVALREFSAWLRDEAGDIEAHHEGEQGNRHRPIVKHLRFLADEAQRRG